MSEMIKMITEGEKVLVRAKGRVISDNAAEFEQELSACLSPETQQMEINCEELEYISSAGLRVFLRLKKKLPQVLLTEVSGDVYEILEVTGFTEILDVKKALRFVSIEGCEIIGKGGHGTVYRLDNDTIIKTFHDGSSLETIEKERMFGRNAFVKGIPCAIAFDVVKCEEGYGLVYEMAGSQSLSTFLCKNPDKLQEYGVRFAKLLKEFNSTPSDVNAYQNAKEMYRENLKNAAHYFTEEENALLMKFLDSIPDAETMLHTDYHPKNVMVNAEGELMLIDMADIAYGCPIFDIGGSCLTLYMVGQNIHELSMQVIGIPFEMSVELWNITLSTYYGTTDPEKLRMLFGRCVAMAFLRMAQTLGMVGAGKAGREESMVATLRKNLFPNIDQYCMLMQLPM